MPYGLAYGPRTWLCETSLPGVDATPGMQCDYMLAMSSMTLALLSVTITTREFVAT